MLWHNISISFSFLWPKNIPSYGYATFWLSVRPLMATAFHMNDFRDFPTPVRISWFQPGRVRQGPEFGDCS